MTDNTRYEEVAQCQPEDDGIDRRGFLKCMAWAGTGVLWTMTGGVLKSYGLGDLMRHGPSSIAQSELHFVQISDSHIGFQKEANPDVIGTFKATLDKIQGLEMSPEFIIHTGDISHLSKPEEFDTVDQMLRQNHRGRVFYVPGEHDVLTDNGKQYLERYGRGTKGSGWYSFDHKGAHFIGLINVLNLKAGGMGALGSEQLAWLENDVRHLPSSTPVVVFAHIPLWTVYPQWGWGTEDSARALASLKRFGSVTVLNGHIHQVMQKVEGNVTFHTAMSTAFPQPAPGTAPSPGPMKVEPARLRSVLGITEVNYREGQHTLAVTDSSLAALGASSAHSTGNTQIRIDNFRFTPMALTVPVGVRVTWINQDDVPHTVVDTKKRFSSPVLDTDQQFTYTFQHPGTYEYFCSLHPTMTGKLRVQPGQ